MDDFKTHCAWNVDKSVKWVQEVACPILKWWLVHRWPPKNLRVQKWCENIAASFSLLSSLTFDSSRPNNSGKKEDVIILFETLYVAIWNLKVARAAAAQELFFASPHCTLLMNNDADAAAEARVFFATLPPPEEPYGDLALFKPILHPDD